MINIGIILIAVIPYVVITGFFVWKTIKLESEVNLHRSEIIRLGNWSQQAAETIFEITQHLKYVVEMDKIKNEFILPSIKGEA